MSDNRSYTTNFRASLVCAVAFPMAVLLLGLLELTRVKEQDLARDNGRVGKVMFCILLAAAGSVTSPILAVRPLLAGDFRPMFWLFPLVAGWAAFLHYYLLPWFRIHL